VQGNIRVTIQCRALHRVVCLREQGAAIEIDEMIAAMHGGSYSVVILRRRNPLSNA